MNFISLKRAFGKFPSILFIFIFFWVYLEYSEIQKMLFYFLFLYSENFQIISLKYTFIIMWFIYLLFLVVKFIWIFFFYISWAATFKLKIKCKIIFRSENFGKLKFILSKDKSHYNIYKFECLRIIRPTVHKFKKKMLFYIYLFRIAYNG